MVQLHHIFMLSVFPFSSLMLTSIVIRSLLAVTRSNWLFTWLALEINIIRFIPLIISSFSNQETESTIKYFLIQALGSRLLLIFSITLFYSLVSSLTSSLLLIIRLIIKLGAAPFHPWFPQVMAGASWSTCFLLSTWQKLGPLFLLCFIFQYSYILFLFSPLTALVGGISGLNQSKLRCLIAYSSLVHLGWIIALSYVGHPLLTILYFIIYVVVASPLFISFYYTGLSFISFSSSAFAMSPLFIRIISILLLSLRGIPPLTGFIPKWISISVLWQSPSTLSILIISSLIRTFYYLRLMFSALLSNQIISSAPYFVNWTGKSFKWMLLFGGFSLFLAPLTMV